MKFKTTPFKHQLDAWNFSRDFRSYGLFHEQGTGKSCTTLMTASWLYEQDKIDGMLVVAPNGVHRNWTDNEIPKHLPDEVPRTSYCYISQKARTKKGQKALSETIDCEGLAILTMGYEAFITEAGKLAAWRFLKKRKTLFVLDESTRIKSPTAKRTRSILKAAKFAPYRRILTGTPVANGPLDLYSQMRFLQTDFWEQFGFGTYTSFKAFFGVFEKGYNYSSGREFSQLLRYQNEDKLHDMISDLTDRVTKDEVLDLPPKLYSTMNFDMTSKQAQLYEAFRSKGIEEILLAIADTNLDLPAPMAIVIMLRLQQITCGYLPNVKGGLDLLGKENPRLDLLVDVCEDIPHQAIVWSRFRKDIDLICDRLKGRCVRYDGSTGSDERAEAIDRFQSGDVQFFVGNPAAAGEGLTLHAARTVVYYSNSFKLTDRLQSESRAHRIGQEHPVHYIDLVCPGTIDEMIITALRAKLDIASMITGDKLKEWLSIES